MDTICTVTDDLLFFLKHVRIQQPYWTPYVFSCDFSESEEDKEEQHDDAQHDYAQHDDAQHDDAANNLLPRVYMFTDAPAQAECYNLGIVEFRKFLSKFVHPSFVEEWRAARRRIQSRCSQNKRRAFLKKVKKCRM